MKKFIMSFVFSLFLGSVFAFADCSSYESQFNFQRAKAQGVKLINEENAKKIALNSAKIKENKIYNYSCELDYDDDFNPNTKKNYQYNYEIEFLTENVKYEYKIDAETGKINEFEIETK